MTKKQLLDRLTTVQGEKLWIGTSAGYGSDGSICYLSSEGITHHGSLVSGDIMLPACSPLSEEDVAEAKRHIQNKTEAQFDHEIIGMVKQDCKPGLKYYSLALGLETIYGAMEELVAEICYIKQEYADPVTIPWSEMTKAQLADWERVLSLIEDGFSSIYDVPDDAEPRTSKGQDADRSREP
jgi:hypothetical protein